MTTSNEHNNAPAVPQEEGRPGIPLRKAYKHLLIVAPAQEVGLTDEALDNLIEDLSEWSRHVVEDTAHQTLESHVREVLEKNPIIAALRAKGQS